MNEATVNDNGGGEFSKGHVPEGALRVTFDDYDLLWEALASSGGDIVLDLKNQNLGPREYLRVVCDELECVVEQAAPFEPGKKELETEVKEVDLSIDQFEQEISSEFPVYFRHVSKTPFAT